MTTNGAGIGQLVQPADDALDAGCIPNGGDIGEQRSQRRHTRGVDRGLVHARREVIAELLLDAPAGPIRLCRELLQEGLQLLPVRLARGEPPAPALRPGGDGVRSSPGAVRERVEVGARVRRSIEVARPRCPSAPDPCADSAVASRAGEIEATPASMSVVASDGRSMRVGPMTYSSRCRKRSGPRAPPRCRRPWRTRRGGPTARSRGSAPRDARRPSGPTRSKVAVASDTTQVAKPRLPAIRAVVETQ